MRITAYNTGDFNAFDAVDFQGNPAPENNTTLHQWSVTDFPVGHFSKKMAALGNEYQHLGGLTMATISGEMHLIHRGGYPDLPNAYTEVFGLTGIYAAENQLSNGYGTLHQAGWTTERELNQVSFDSNSPISVCSDGQELTFVWVAKKTGSIQYIKGRYEASK